MEGESRGLLGVGQVGSSGDPRKQEQKALNHLGVKGTEDRLGTWVIREES